MYEAFEKLTDDKKIKILNAALKEFSKNTYNKASTNTIIKDAGISKGVLFHYFKNKQGLYQYLIDFSINKYSTAFQVKQSVDTTDLFTRIREWCAIEFTLLSQMPHVPKFLARVYTDTSNNDVIDKSSFADNTLSNFKVLLLDGIDFSPFKDDIDIEAALNVLWWTIEKLTEEYSIKLEESNFDLSPSSPILNSILEDVDRYLTLLQNMYYK